MRTGQLIIAVGLVLACSTAWAGDLCWDLDHMCIPVVSSSATEIKHRAPFRKCYEHNYDRLFEQMKKEGETCGSCSGMKAEAADKCKKYLTPEEMQCLDKTTIGAWAGDPFHCEDGQPN